MNAQHVFSTQGFSHVVVDSRLVPLDEWHPSDTTKVVGYGVARDKYGIIEAVFEPVTTQEA